MIRRRDAIDSLKGELNVTVRDNTVLKSYLKREIEETEWLEGEVDRYAGEIQGKDREVLDLRDEVVRMQVRLDERDTALREAISKQQDHAAQLAVSRNTSTRLESEKAKLAQELHKREDELAKLIDHFKAESRSVRKTIKALDIEKLTNKEAKVAYATQLHGTTDQLDSLRMKVVKYERDIPVFAARAENAEIKLTQLEAQNEDMEVRLKQQTERCMDLARQLHVAKGQLRAHRGGDDNDAQAGKELASVERARVRAAIDHDIKAGIPARMKDVEVNVLRDAVEHKSVQLAEAHRTVADLETVETDFHKVTSIIKTLPPRYRELFSDSVPDARTCQREPRLTPVPSDRPATDRPDKLCTPKRKPVIQSPEG